MAGTINIGTGEHAMRVLALMDTLGIDDPDDLDGVAQAIQRSVTLAVGQHVARQDRPPANWLIVLEGAGHVTIDGAVTATVTAGDSVGEMTVRGDASRRAVFTATEPTRILEMDGSVLPEPAGGARSLAQTTAAHSGPQVP